MRHTPYSQLSSIERTLLDQAEKAMENAYNPYSKFSVGAALLAQDGRIIVGANHENASYGMTICAERAALHHANALRVRMFEKIAVIARGEDFETQAPTSPCGACRQKIYEAAQVSERTMNTGGTSLDVIMSTTRKDKILIATIDELFPLAFGPADLGIDIKKYQS